MRTEWPWAIGGLLALCVAWGVSLAGPSSVARGRQLARANCARCHAIEGSAPSPMADVPRFPDLEGTSGGRDIDEIFAYGILSPHPPMPIFLAGSGPMADVLAFVRSVQKRAPDRSPRPSPPPAF